MRRKSTAQMDCSIARALDVVGEWWTLLIVRDLGINGVHRFDELQKSLGIARNVLALRLQKLVDHEIVETRMYRERPERYEYYLSEKGRGLASVLYALLEWGDRWTRDGTPPPVRIEHAVCGHSLVTTLSCPECKRIVPKESRRLVRTASRLR
ncbi:MAG: helix-turn-helix transcriptional regulator [Candidatus Eremiobacteraeota bacterium]|nr:helix-turn-helix transcriptional regulator [Candidatus Eremiobacteraeota bacterium]